MVCLHAYIYIFIVCCLSFICLPDTTQQTISFLSTFYHHQNYFSDDFLLSRLCCAVAERLLMSTHLFLYNCAMILVPCLTASRPKVVQALFPLLELLLSCMNQIAALQSVHDRAKWTVHMVAAE